MRWNSDYFKKLQASPVGRGRRIFLIKDFLRKLDQCCSDGSGYRGRLDGENIVPVGAFSVTKRLSNISEKNFFCRHNVSRSHVFRISFFRPSNRTKNLKFPSTSHEKLVSNAMKLMTPRMNQWTKLKGILRIKRTFILYLYRERWKAEFQTSAHYFNGQKGTEALKQIDFSSQQGKSCTQNEDTSAQKKKSHSKTLLKIRRDSCWVASILICCG